jgi:hypothetical protein
MGTITYDGMVVEFDDRLLAHLQIVIVQKFRAREAFLMSWLDALNDGDGRSALWLTPDAPLHFKFNGSRPPLIDRGWLEVLQRSAASGSGLLVQNSEGALIRAAHQARQRQPAWA